MSIYITSKMYNLGILLNDQNKQAKYMQIYMFSRRYMQGLIGVRKYIVFIDQIKNIDQIKGVSRQSMGRVGKGL